MVLEEILQLDRSPFDGGVMAEKMENNGDDLLTQNVCILLVSRYIERFAGQYEFSISVPQWNYYVNRADGKKTFASNVYTDYAVNFEKKSQDMMKCLFKEIMVCCGWMYGCIHLLNDNRISTLATSENASEEDWGQAFSTIRIFEKLKKQGYSNIKVAVCWSRRVYDYYKFYEENQKVVRACFEDGADAIEQILRHITDPFAVGLGDEFRYNKGNSYIMVFFTAFHSDGTIDSSDFDYNFFVQIMVLDMLLGCAEEMLGYRKEEKLIGQV